MTQFVGLRAKTYSSLIVDGSEDSLKIDSLKKVNVKLIRKYKSILNTQQWLKSERHFVLTEEINKIALIIIKECNQFNWFDRNICLWNEQRSSKWKRRY